MQKLNHVAIIMDGNGRWAKNNNLPRTFGHTFGVNVACNIINESIALGLKQLTLFALSTENMKRPPVEVNFILKLFERLLKNEVQNFIEKGVRFKFIGDIQSLAPQIRDLSYYSEKKSSSNSGLIVTIAVNYSGRWHLSNVARELALESKNGKIEANDISEDVIQSKIQELVTTDPDLLIRTGDEHRISNFMLWSLAYTEIYFSERFWPDFTKEDFNVACDFYRTKNRRYGLIKDAEYE
jgi:undecaprenyl diphosphate synthase